MRRLSTKGFFFTASVFLLSACLFAASPPIAGATTITYYFDDWIVGGAVGSLATNPPYIGAPTSFGSITFTDDAGNSKYVDVSVGISAPYKILAFGFNFNAFQPPTFSGPDKTKDWFFAFDSSNPAGVNVQGKQDTFKADGSGNYGNFDINVSGSALTSASTQTFTGTLKYEEWNLKTNNPHKGDPTTLTGNVADLDVSNFEVKDSQATLYAWIHVGNVTPGPGSIALGAVPDLPPQAIPEPATMLLFGSGLIGLVGYGRKKFFKK